MINYPFFHLIGHCFKYFYDYEKTSFKIYLISFLNLLLLFLLMVNRKEVPSLKSGNDSI